MSVSQKMDPPILIVADFLFWVHDTVMRWVGDSHWLCGLAVKRCGVFADHSHIELWDVSAVPVLFSSMMCLYSTESSFFLSSDLVCSHPLHFWRTDIVPVGRFWFHFNRKYSRVGQLKIRMFRSSNAYINDIKRLSRWTKPIYTSKNIAML